jgi:hypothetical protein
MKGGRIPRGRRKLEAQLDPRESKTMKRRSAGERPFDEEEDEETASGAFAVCER